MVVADWRHTAAAAAAADKIQVACMVDSVILN